MSENRFNEDKQELIECLNNLPRSLATRLICLLALGAIKSIRADYRYWPGVERIVFNATMLLFCRDKLVNEELAEMVNYGIQVDDLRGFTDDPLRFAEILDDVEARAMRLLSADASHDS